MCVIFEIGSLLFSPIDVELLVLLPHLPSVGL